MNGENRRSRIEDILTNSYPALDGYNYIKLKVTDSVKMTGSAINGAIGCWLFTPRSYAELAEDTELEQRILENKLQPGVSGLAAFAIAGTGAVLAAKYVI